MNAKMVSLSAKVTPTEVKVKIVDENDGPGEYYRMALSHDEWARLVVAVNKAAYTQQEQSVELDP